MDVISDDCLRLILTNLDKYDIYICIFVCKKWNNIIKKNEMLEAFSIKELSEDIKSHLKRMDRYKDRMLDNESFHYTEDCIMRDFIFLIKNLKFNSKNFYTIKNFAAQIDEINNFDYDRWYA